MESMIDHFEVDTALLLSHSTAGHVRPRICQEYCLDCLLFSSCTESFEQLNRFCRPLSQFTSICLHLSMLFVCYLFCVSLYCM